MTTSLEIPASPGVQGPGEMIRRLGWHGLDLLERDLVVAHDSQIDSRVDLAEPLHEVVGERIVIIDQENHEPANRSNRHAGQICATEALPLWIVTYQTMPPEENAGGMRPHGRAGGAMIQDDLTGADSASTGRISSPNRGGERCS